MSAFTPNQYGIVREAYQFVHKGYSPAINPGTRLEEYQIPSPRIGWWYEVDFLTVKFHYIGDYVTPLPAGHRDDEPFPGSGQFGLNATLRFMVNGGVQIITVPLTSDPNQPGASLEDEYNTYEAQFGGGPFNFSWRDTMIFHNQFDMNWSFTGAPGDTGQLDLYTYITLAGRRYKGG